MSGSLDAWRRSSLEVRVGVEDGVRGLVRVPLAFLVGGGDGNLPSWSTATSFRLCALVRALGFVMLCVVCVVC